MEKTVAASVSEPPSLSILDRTSVKAAKSGLASTDECPRKGWVKLWTRNGHHTTMETNCKTWRCRSCRDRLVTRFKLLVETGCSLLPQSALITVTYRADVERGPTAEYVKRDWRALLRRTEQLWEMPWLRVMELTKKDVPHHHLVAGADREVRCYRRFLHKDFTRVFDSCGCLSHELSRVWYAVTGDSYIVHAMPVSGAAGAASYLAKYLAKTHFDSQERLDALGMSRRWSTSRNWPGDKRLRLKRTDEGGWFQKAFTYGRMAPAEQQYDAKSLALRNGTPVQLARVAKREKMRAVRQLERLVTNVHQDDRPPNAGD